MDISKNCPMTGISYHATKDLRFWFNKKTLFSTSAKIGLSCDIKSLFQKSVDQKLQIFNSIFHPVRLQLFYNDLIADSTQQYISIAKEISNFLHYW